VKQPPTSPSSSAASGELGLQNLWTAFAQSVRDNVIGEVAVQVLRFGGLIVLARALRPDDFGLFRILVVVSAFAMLTIESGIPDALIQKKVLTPAHESTAWCVSIVLASISTAMMYLAAPLLARVMHMPRLIVSIQLLCIPILLEGTAVTANARLRRSLRFGALAIADVAGEGGFLVVALAVLWRGYPRASLAAGLGARFALHAIVIWIADPYFPREAPRVWAGRDFARFSSSATGAKLISTLSSNADFLLVGRLLGSSALGFYSMAWDLLRFIPDRLYRVAGRVTLPAFCRLQDDNVRLARAYRAFFRYLARITIPIVTCAVIVAPELIGAIYGSQWVPAARQMRLLAPGLILLGLRCGMGSIYFTKDHPSFDIYQNGARTILIVGVVIPTSAIGLDAVCMGMSVVESVVTIAGVWMACALIDLSIVTLAQEALPALVLTAMCALATVGGKSLALALDLHGAALAAFAIVPAVVVFTWREAGFFRTIPGRAFSSGEPSRIELSEERT
jgi:O-antigen/teichoic acid export membrane protein